MSRVIDNRGIENIVSEEEFLRARCLALVEEHHRLRRMLDDANLRVARMERELTPTVPTECQDVVAGRWWAL